MKFAYGVASAKGKGKSAVPVSQASPFGWGCGATAASPRAYTLRPAHHTPMAASVGASFAHLPTNLRNFVASWGLGDEAQTILLSLAPDVQERVMKEFSPHDAERDANGIFLRFARSVGAGAGPAHRQVLSHSSGELSAPARIQRPARQHAPANSQTAAHSTDEIATFVSQWNLHDDAQQVLYSLSPELMMKVMTDFSPRDTSSDVNNIFMKFAQGVGKGKGKPAPSFGKGKGKGKWSPY